MSNQISDNIGLHLSAEQAVDKVVNHIQLFWAQSMKNDLIAYYKNDGQLLNELSKLATIKLAEMQAAD
ncbi:formate dehydrogenase subunit delta [Thalassotalea fonticola]|uniref:Formate dehydrogenase subunit delta n=1 Tax=Thalassotalea fonticola TaxID=3065649 RepID=A0ABZ0GLI6_9GAMM|nr:formate dehydrogenase subunit delta [Colwelliaceae bacterium S1-1]